jgi:pimeloyl-ACP methyl ester carboxylesterase
VLFSFYECRFAPRRSWAKLIESGGRMRPRTQYAKSGDVCLAYQVTGRGSVDLLIAPGFISHLDHFWEEPELARFLHELKSFTRLILFDKRGTGLSDRTVGIPHLEERIDDIRAVLDASHSKQAVLVGVSEGGAMAILFAATYPERVSALILDSAIMYAPTDVPSLKNSDSSEWENAALQTWGTGKSLRHFAPSRADDPHMVEWWATLERLSVSPSAPLVCHSHLSMPNDPRLPLQRAWHPVSA